MRQSNMKSWMLSVGLVFFLGANAAAQSLTWTGTPALGRTVMITIQGPPGAPYLLGVSNSPGPTILPPLPPIQLGLPFFYVVGPTPNSPFQPAFDLSGEAQVPLTIPVNLALFGQTFWLQAAYADSTNPLLISFTNGISFTLSSPIDAPTITSVTPAFGGASGGDMITITGANFLPGPVSATLGGQALTDFVAVSSTTLEGRVPTGVPNTTASLLVTTPSGAASLGAAYAYTPEVPTVSSIIPDHVQVDGGAILTLQGEGLGPGTTVVLAGFTLSPLSQTASEFVAFAPPFGSIGFVDLWVSSAQGSSFRSQAFRYTIPLDVGDGSDGVFAPTSNVTLQTGPNLGQFQFESFHIPAGVTVRALGVYPLSIRCRGEVRIEGTLDISGGDPGQPSIAGAGGFPGAVGVLNSTALIPGFGPGAGAVPSTGQGQCSLCAGHAMEATNVSNCGVVSVYGSPMLTPILGGSGGGLVSSSGLVLQAGGGGGALDISAGSSVLVSGTIDASGGPALTPQGFNLGAGSGGAIRIRTQGTMSLTGLATVAGAAGGSPSSSCSSSRGRWLVQTWTGQTSTTLTPTIPPGVY